MPEALFKCQVHALQPDFCFVKRRGVCTTLTVDTGLPLIWQGEIQIHILQGRSWQHVLRCTWHNQSSCLEVVECTQGPSKKHGKTRNYTTQKQGWEGNVIFSRVCRSLPSFSCMYCASQHLEKAALHPLCPKSRLKYFQCIPGLRFQQV